MPLPRIRPRFALTAFLMAWPLPRLSAQDADLIVRNARVWTGDSARPRAQALAVRGERLVAVGSDVEIERYRSPRTRVIDAGGRLVTPGFIDDHTHFSQAGALLIGANLLDVSSPAPFASRVKAAVARMSSVRGSPAATGVRTRTGPRTVPARALRRTPRARAASHPIERSSTRSAALLQSCSIAGTEAPGSRTETRWSARGCHALAPFAASSA